MFPSSEVGERITTTTPTEAYQTRQAREVACKIQTVANGRRNRVRQEEECNGTTEGGSTLLSQALNDSGGERTSGSYTQSASLPSLRTQKSSVAWRRCATECRQFRVLQGGGCERMPVRGRDAWGEGKGEEADHPFARLSARESLKLLVGFTDGLGTESTADGGDRYSSEDVDTCLSSDVTAARSAATGSRFTGRRVRFSARARYHECRPSRCPPLLEPIFCVHTNYEYYTPDEHPRLKTITNGCTHLVHSSTPPGAETAILPSSWSHSMFGNHRFD